MILYECTLVRQSTNIDTYYIHIATYCTHIDTYCTHIDTYYTHIASSSARCVQCVDGYTDAETGNALVERTIPGYTLGWSVTAPSGRMLTPYSSIYLVSLALVTRLDLHDCNDAV